MDQGSTVVIVEDSNGFIFGGYATESWALGPNYLGNENSFLFTLRPKMRCFPSTGYNPHYQYLNLHQQTMPNGMVSVPDVQNILYVKLMIAIGSCLTDFKVNIIMMK